MSARTEKTLQMMLPFSDAMQQERYYLLLEYLDTTLSALDRNKYKKNSVFLAALFEGILGGVHDIGHTQNVWTGICEVDQAWAIANPQSRSEENWTLVADGKPDNVLCSDVATSNPIVKIGDLGLGKYPLLPTRRSVQAKSAISVHPDGFRAKVTQSPAMRAPEVWAGWGRWHVSDVYSVMSTVLSWLQAGVLGEHDVKDVYRALSDAWSIAKMVKPLETEDEKTLDPPDDADGHVKSMYEIRTSYSHAARRRYSREPARPGTASRGGSRDSGHHA